MENANVRELYGLTAASLILTFTSEIIVSVLVSTVNSMINIICSLFIAKVALIFNNCEKILNREASKNIKSLLKAFCVVCKNMFDIPSFFVNK